MTTLGSCTPNVVDREITKGACVVRNVHVGHARGGGSEVASPRAGVRFTAPQTCELRLLTGEPQALLLKST